MHVEQWLIITERLGQWKFSMSLFKKIERIFKSRKNVNKSFIRRIKFKKKPEIFSFEAHFYKKSFILHLKFKKTSAQEIIYFDFQNSLGCSPEISALRNHQLHSQRANWCLCSEVSYILWKNFLSATVKSRTF